MTPDQKSNFLHSKVTEFEERIKALEEKFNKSLKTQNTVITAKIVNPEVRVEEKEVK